MGKIKFLRLKEDNKFSTGDEGLSYNLVPIRNPKQQQTINDTADKHVLNF